MGLEAPADPECLKASPADESQIDLSWNPVPGVESYNIKRTTPNDGPELIVANVTDTGFRDECLLPGFAYSYIVSALNSAGESVNSDLAGATTEPGNTP